MSLPRRIERALRQRVAEPAAAALERALNFTVFSRSVIVRRHGTSALRILRRGLLFVRSGLQLKVRRIRGLDERGRERQILHVGEHEATAWLAGKILPAGFEEEEISSVRPWQLRAFLALASASADLVVCEVNRFLTPRLPGSPRWTIPRWARMRIPLESSWEKMRMRFRKSALTQVRAVRGQGFDHRVVPACEVFAEFHDRMYLPFVRSRHGSETILHSKEELESFVQRGTILQVLWGGDWLAGALNAVAGRDLRCVVLGVRDGDPRLVSRHVVKALFCFTIQWAIAQGHAGVDLGRVRPLCEDPVLRQKRRWGATIDLDPWEESRMVVLPGRSRDLFDELPLRHPFLEESPDGLQARIRTEGPVPCTPEALEEIVESHAIPGLCRIVLAGSDGSERTVELECGVPGGAAESPDPPAQRIPVAAGDRRRLLSLTGPHKRAGM